MIGLKVLNYFNEREVWDSMKQTMDAVYENGVFRPLNKINT
ncbi:MAG: antitoxin family protein [Candidatus Latescibacteria bacterium]|nr:antitoxin family protein [Candidatus Latescibacterota bacterium]